MRKHCLLVVVIASLVLGMAGCNAAESASPPPNYPNHPITIVVPMGPGGGSDIQARAIAAIGSKYFGQSLVVINKPGASGSVAHNAYKNERPDGYTLILAADSLITINPHLYERMPLDTLKDLTPIASLVSNQFVLSVNPALPVKTFAEFVEYARRSDPPPAMVMPLSIRSLASSGGHFSSTSLTSATAAL